MIKMKLKKKRLYNPNFPNILEVQNFQLKNDQHTHQVVVKRRRFKRTFLQPLRADKKVYMSSKDKQIKQIAEYILKMKRQGLRYSINPEE